MKLVDSIIVFIEDNDASELMKNVYDIGCEMVIDYDNRLYPDTNTFFNRRRKVTIFGTHNELEALKKRLNL